MAPKQGYSRIIHMLVLFSIILSSLSVTIIDVDGALSSSGVDITIDGPTEVFVNQTESYQVKIIGAFSDRSKNWSLKASIDEESVEKASVTPRVNDSDDSNVFTVKFTAVKEGKIKLKLNGFCSDGNSTRQASTSLKIKAVEPSTVSIKLDNPNDIELNNIQVGVYVDGTLKRVHDVDILGPSKSKKLLINWSKEGLEDGKHTLQIWVDYNYKGDTDEFDKNEMVLEKDFYVEGKGFMAQYGWAVAIAVIVGIIGLFYFMNMRRKRRRPW